MPRFRDSLPQLSGEFFLTDGGLETTLIFHDDIDLPEFAAFVLLDTDEGCERLRQYYRGYAELARNAYAGFILESMTWRASRDWASKLGMPLDQVMSLNRKSIALLADIRREYEAYIPHMVISGCIGPNGDGYSPDTIMTIEEAQAYHHQQIAAFKETEADMVSALTVTSTSEGTGIARAAESESIPLVLSFTVETDGRLPSGETLEQAIGEVDASTNGSPAYYMINCAHPTHFRSVLGSGEWTERIHGIRANASTKSHAELDEATELDDGDPKEFGLQYQELRERLSNLNIFGGCCGTDERHIAAICQAFGRYK